MSSGAAENPMAERAIPTGFVAHYSVSGCVNIGRAICRLV
jgi:hypothetical protein